MNATLALSAALLGLTLATAHAAPPAPHAFVPHWTKMPILTPEARAAGVFPGGEGGQWPRGPVAVSPADPNFLLLPIDVGGLYRSLDGGAHWEVSMVGWDARGANAFAIDPKNARRAIGVASNSMEWNPGWGPSPHGLYLSTDKAASWRHVLAATPGVGGAVAYDAHSYDVPRGFCAVAYYLSPHGGLFQSGDGGASWARLGDGPTPGIKDRDWTQGGGIVASLAVDGRTGAVYIGGAGGVFRSGDQGQTWARVREADTFGLSLGPDGAVYVSGADKVAVSQDGGKTWAALACAGLDTLGGKPVQNLAVSPADPRRMLCWVAGDNWQWTRYVSSDGGATFLKVTLDSAHAALPYNARQGYATWSPSDPNVAYSLGGDWVTKSTNGGKNFHWSNNGYNGIMVGGLFNFSVHAPNTVFLAFQDYNGAFTTDGGKTWNYRDISGKGWGGQEYGAHAVDSQVMWCGDSESWGPPRRLRLSRDGGKTWAFVPGPDGKPLPFSGSDVSLSDPADANILFASDLRSGDKGRAWSPMAGCDGVFTYGPITKALYGKKGDAVVRSQDHGASWQKVADIEGGLSDLAVDEKAHRVYAASQDRLKVWANGVWATLETPKDQYGSARVWTVATDPQAPNVVYVGGPRNTYASHATVCRSLDGGLTWENLTVNTALIGGLADGPHEVSAIRVHPVTREAWVNGQCYGMWRIAPPTPGERGVSAAQASAPPAVLPASTPPLAAGR